MDEHTDTINNAILVADEQGRMDVIHTVAQLLADEVRVLRARVRDPGAHHVWTTRGERGGHFCENCGIRMGEDALVNSYCGKYVEGQTTASRTEELEELDGQWQSVTGHKTPASYVARSNQRELPRPHRMSTLDSALHPPLEGPVPWSRLRKAPSPGRYCVVCGGEQRHCRSGWVCEQGHGGADYTLGPPEPEPEQDSKP